MHAFFFPHQLLAPINLYISALHRNPLTAHAAFETWINQLDIGKIDFVQHKLIGLVAARHANALVDHNHAGVLLNIRRHGRLRAHSNLSILRNFLNTPGVSDLGLIAIGEIRECLFAGLSDIGDLDTFELAISATQLNAALEGLPIAGWEIQHPPIRPRGRNVSLINFYNPLLKVFLKIIAIDHPSTDNQPFTNYKGISVLTDASHSSFMRSRAAGLLARRDQFLFDIYRARQTLHASDHLSHLGINNLPWLFIYSGNIIFG